ncbi:unnamed protein product, partial [Brachionus calyciflorus]
SVDYKSITTKVEDQSFLVHKLNAMSLKTPTKFSGECFYCYKSGHRKSECRKRLSEEKYGRNGNQRRYDSDKRNKRVTFYNAEKTPNSRKKTKADDMAALSAKRVDCAIGDLIVSSNGWFGKKQFIFADVAEAGISGLDGRKRSV